MSESEAGRLRAHGISAGYGAKLVLDGLDFTVGPGRFTAVIGPNGCGKSTLVKALTRTLPVRSGRVDLDGRPLSRWKPKELARHVALLPQEPVVPDGVTVRSLAARGRHPYHSPLRPGAPGDTTAVDAALAATGIEELADRQVGELSGGQRQRAWVAMVLAQDTEFVFLDEPTSFLDIAHQIDVLTLCVQMSRQGKSVVAVLHDLNQAARFADDLVVMHHGSIVARGAPGDVLDARLVAEVFDLDAVIAADPETSSPMVVPRA